MSVLFFIIYINLYNKQKSSKKKIFKSLNDIINAKLL